MTIRFTKDAEKAVQNLDKKTKQRVKTALLKIPEGDIKPLEGHKPYLRLRVGGLRIIFRYGEEYIVWIEKIAPRGDVYKGGF